MMYVSGSEERGEKKGKARLKAKRLHRQRLMFPVAGKMLRLVHGATRTRFDSVCATGEGC